ncbi:hypothetical protein [Amaricoccus sp.]|uniref:hypothetical protein n=1 Tax=Amaricoccus sp. TaxID=1872485 RepID=UPI00262DC5BA|nr:hypothetical protein [Amaricoccus sp.]HRO12091.1 hypothetical protein [Amaricoccus sp.]
MLSSRDPAALLALLLLAAPAAGQEILTPEAFEAMAEGRTLHFTHLGRPYGAEQYLPGRRSIWRYADGSCTQGRWWAEGERICFRYDTDPEAQCWRFLPRPGGLAAERLEGAAATGFTVEMSRADTAPLACPGPKVGT